MKYLQYLIYAFFKYLFIFTPRIISKQFLKLLALFIYKLNLKHTKIARINLDFAFRNIKTKKEKEKIIHLSYLNLLYNMYEFIDNQFTSQENILSKAKMIGEDYVLNAIKDERQIIFIASHFGAWEECIPCIAIKYGTLSVVNRRMNNKLINKEYVKARDRNNIVMIEKKSAAKGMLRALKNGHNLAVAVDQNTSSGIDIEFFNKRTKATDSTSRLAVKFDTLLIPTFCAINDLGDYTIEFKKPINHRELKSENKIKILTQLQASCIEKEIRKLPSQWFWQHKRWKFYYPDLY